MKKSKSNIALWLLLIAAIGGGAAYLIIRKKKKIEKSWEDSNISPAQRQTGLLVKTKTTQPNTTTTSTSTIRRNAMSTLKAIKDNIKKNIQKNAGLTGCNR